jgi:hypothetical protein
LKCRLAGEVDGECSEIVAATGRQSRSDSFRAFFEAETAIGHGFRKYSYCALAFAI